LGQKILLGSRQWRRIGWVRWDDFLVRFAESGGSALMVRSLLPECAFGVRSARLIRRVPAARPYWPPAFDTGPVFKNGKLLHLNSALQKRLKINAAQIVQNSCRPCENSVE
jgi:hypothetical protein